MKKSNIIVLVFLGLFLVIFTVPNKIVHLEAAPKLGKAFKVNSFFAEQDALQESATSGAIVTVRYYGNRQKGRAYPYCILFHSKIR